MLPLEVALLDPDASSMSPPRPAAAPPAVTRMRPPLSVVVVAPLASPAVILTSPPSPPFGPSLLPLPAVICTEPPFCSASRVSPAVRTMSPPSDPAEDAHRVPSCPSAHLLILQKDCVPPT